MKRLFAIAVILIAIASTASAKVISYRYEIPGTNGQYSIEFPLSYIVKSSDMRSYDPAVYVYGFDKEETMQEMKQDGFEIIAFDSDWNDVVIFIEKVGSCMDCSSQDLSLIDLKKMAKEFGEFYYEYRDNITPINEDNLGIVYESANLNYIYIAYEWDDDGSKTFTEHYYLFEPEYGLDICCAYYTKDADVFSESIDRMEFITDSVIKHK